MHRACRHGAPAVAPICEGVLTHISACMSVLGSGCPPRGKHHICVSWHEDFIEIASRGMSKGGSG